MIKDDMFDKMFGKWKVISLVPYVKKPSRSSSRHAYYICFCQCELKTTQAIRATLLRTGYTKECRICKKLAKRGGVSE